MDSEGFGPPERVYVENEWYDGPREGVADIDNVPHRFKSLFGEAKDEYLDPFAVWPIDRASLDLEIEQWQIFVAWNARFETGAARLESHPAFAGVNPSWERINERLRPGRKDVPANARCALAKIDWLDNQSRYGPDGPDYRLRWRIL
jgi:hypothetical protein